MNEPADFDDFWMTLAATARAVDPQPSILHDRQGRTCVRFSSTSGLRLGAWMTLPEGPIESAVVVGHGYGGADGPDTRWAPPTAAVFYPIARGMPALSRVEGIPDHSSKHVLHGIESRDTYIQGGCAADLWCAITAFECVLQVALGEKHGGLKLGYFGPSFGGGIGAMAIPFESRIDVASLYVPSFGANRERLAVDCVGSGAQVSRWVEKHPEAWEVLDYFDAATSAARITIPTIVAAATVDPAVPPVGQHAIARAIPEEYRRVISMTAGHQPYDQEDQELAHLAQRTRELFSVNSAVVSR